MPKGRKDMVTKALKKQVFLAEESDTLALGARIAQMVRIGDVLALRGDLGAGKTCFARGFIRELVQGDKEMEVPSPTFTLVQTYEAPDFDIWHFDLYRLEAPKEVWELGWEEALDDGVCLIEWPQRAGDLLPADLVTIELEMTDEGGRRALLSGTEAWQTRLEAIEI